MNKLIGQSKSAPASVVRQMYPRAVAEAGIPYGSTETVWTIWTAPTHAVELATGRSRIEAWREAAKRCSP